MARKRKIATKEDSDSDGELGVSVPKASPQKKRYSFRQRKSVFYQEDDFDGGSIPQKEYHVSSKDTDDYPFTIDEELLKEESESDTESVESLKELQVSPYLMSYEPTPAIMGSGYLIDFEDVIRADIVINNKRIDYDNVISKSEIKLHDEGPSESPVQTGRKRGRPPKNKSVDLLVNQQKFDGNKEELPITNDLEIKEENLDGNVPITILKELTSTQLQEEAFDEDVPLKYFLEEAASLEQVPEVKVEEPVLQKPIYPVKMPSYNTKDELPNSDYKPTDEELLFNDLLLTGRKLNECKYEEEEDDVVEVPLKHETIIVLDD